MTLLRLGLWVLIPTMAFARLCQAWIITIYDWDTAELLIDADLEDRSTGNFANIAHPYALVIASLILRFLRVVGLAPRTAWFLGLAAIFIATVVAIYWVTYRLSQSQTWALSLTTFYVVSPSTHEILGRQEENLLYHLPFVLTVYFLNRFAEDPEEKRSLYLGLFTLWCVSVCHFQPSASFMIAFGLWVLIHWFKRDLEKNDIRFKFFAFASVLPGIFLLFLFVTGLMAYVPYHKKWYSIFTVADISNYVKVYFNSFQHFMFTKAGGFGKLHTFDYYVFSWDWILLGVFLVVTSVLISLKTKRVPSFVYWGAMIFISLYEPNIEERWDVILLSLICLLAAAPKKGWVHYASIGLVGFMLFNLPSHGFDALSEWESENKNVNFVAQQMEGESIIYGTHEGLRRIVMQVPYGTQFRHLNKITEVSHGKVMIQHKEEKLILESLGKKIGPATSGCYRANHCRIYDFITP